MSLYLCIISEGVDLAGVDVGAYSDFHDFRKFIQDHLEGGNAGSRFPTLILHSDSEGQWTPAECRLLRSELAKILAELKRLPPHPFLSEWQAATAHSLDLTPANASESFIDVDGEPLADQLMCLADLAISLGQPIMFQ